MGTWIEIFPPTVLVFSPSRRSLQWERGLKCLFLGLFWEFLLSFPAMGTWIEIPPCLYPLSPEGSFPAMGTWIEITVLIMFLMMDTVVPCNGNVDWNSRPGSPPPSCYCRSLQWERGLKYIRLAGTEHVSQSFPAMGTWIEIFCARRPKTTGRVVPCNGNVDWNICESICVSVRIPSFPAMGTWIEISLIPFLLLALQSSFPAMGTWIEISIVSTKQHYLHSRSLQWERGLKCLRCIRCHAIPPVVPCNGNVDWNYSLEKYGEKSPSSFPAMGTWIEIMLHLATLAPYHVVPCNGNVDWNSSTSSMGAD